MTMRVFKAANEGFLPVVFRVYRNFEHGANKGRPNPETFFTVTLERCIIPGKIETVGDTIGRLKKMFNEGHYRYSILAAQETDFEREQRRRRDGIEVVVPITTPEAKKAGYDPLNGDEGAASTPTKSVIAVDDEALGVQADDGKVKAKRAKKKPVKELPSEAAAA